MNNPGKILALPPSSSVGSSNINAIAPIPESSSVGVNYSSSAIPVSSSIDESEKKFSPQERKIAEVLEKEGHYVKAKKESEVDGERTADAEVNGILAEFKSFGSGATNGTVKNVINKSIKRGGQARYIIIDARGSGLTEAEAIQGLERVKNITRGKLDSVRIIGDGFDITSKDFK
ncbi:MAG TPA: hypothetical protein VK184_02865 [Nostocaceae cyanobacterium]|nr:hypothetical protein [Nostocaceae cyanobacterium]